VTARRDIVLGVLSALIIVVLMYMLIGSHVVAIPPIQGQRWLSWKFLTSTYNWQDKALWAGSPEVVTSVLWDYRGIDTVYETSVFFLAIIGGLMLVRDYKPRGKPMGKGMSLISRTVVKIVLVAVPVVAASIALHGHLTPGGGFQGGSVFAVSSLLAIIGLGTGFLLGRGWSKSRLLGFRTLGLIIISSIALAIPFVGLLNGLHAYIIQNQWKPWAPIGFGYLADLPGLGSILYSGTLVFLNIAEFLAVSAGLSLAFIIMSLPREELKRSGGVEK